MKSKGKKTSLTLSDIIKLKKKSSFSKNGSSKRVRIAGIPEYTLKAMEHFFTKTTSKKG